MFDAVEKFEELQRINEDLFKKMGKLVGATLGKKQKPVHKSMANAANVIAKHQQKGQSPEECKPFGTEPNNQFFSEMGAKSAQFGRNGKVKDISGLGISKRELRCYDLNKDKYGIKWLFDGTYEAEKVWGKGGKIYFLGTWKGGEFKGIMVSPSKFEGGDFKGKYIGDKPEMQAKAQKTGQKPFVIPRSYGSLEIASNLDVLSGKEVLIYKQVVKDISNGAFLLKLKQLRKLIKSGDIDGYGNFPTLRYLFTQEGEFSKQISQDEGNLMQYMVNYKKAIIDNFIKKDGSENEHLQNIHIRNLRKYLGLAPAQTIKQAPQQQGAQGGTSPRGQKLVQTLGPGSMKEGKLSLKSVISDIIKAKEA